MSVMPILRRIRTCVRRIEGSKEGGWRMGRRARARANGASRAAAAKRRNEKLRALSRIPELQNVFAGKGVLGVESKVDQPSA